MGPVGMEWLFTPWNFYPVKPLFLFCLTGACKWQAKRISLGWQKIWRRLACKLKRKARPHYLWSAILWQKSSRLWQEKHIRTAEERIPWIPWGLLCPPETECKKDDKACLHQCGLAGFSEQTSYGRITWSVNPDRWLSQNIKQNWMAAHPHHSGPYVSPSRRLYEPEAAQRFSAVVVSAMQKKRILGVTSRYVIILKQ